MAVTENQFELSGLFADRDTTRQSQESLSKSNGNNVGIHFLRVTGTYAGALLS